MSKKNNEDTSIEENKKNIKSVFISDIHIGCGKNRVNHVLEVLDQYEFENLFLVGDIIDGWALAKRWKWKKSYGHLINKLIKLKSEGKNVVYVAGNHDDFLREFCPLHLSMVDIYEEFIYKDMMIIHGDKFDAILKGKKYLYFLGEYMYRVMIYINMIFPGFSKRAKKITKDKVNYLSDFYNLAINYAKAKRCEKIIVGHTHQQEFRNINGIEYWNCGDFREEARYLIEHNDGTLELMNHED